MRGRILFFTLAVVVCLHRAGQAALIVNPPQPITHRVTVQLIETALDNGTSPATVFGDATQRALIEGMVDTVWAQAGIDVDFLPAVVRYDDTFAYQGNRPPNQVRPINDLNEILIDAQMEGGIMHPDSSVIDVFFVRIVPGWDQKGANWVTGIGNVGTNGIAQYIGTSSSRDNIAHWVAHEIGHNLGLFHTAGGGAQNLMNASSTISSQLTDTQISAIFQTSYRYDAVAYIPPGGTGFPQPLSGFLDGDYNHDGRVDTADYTLWRDTTGQTGSGLVADGNGDHKVDATDYVVWQTHFGFVAGSGQASALASPEPATLVHLITAILGLTCSGRRSRRAAQ